MFRNGRFSPAHCARVIEAWVEHEPEERERKKVEVVRERNSLLYYLIDFSKVIVDAIIFRLSVVCLFSLGQRRRSTDNFTAFYQKRRMRNADHSFDKPDCFSD